MLTFSMLGALVILAFLSMAGSLASFGRKRMR
jgi:hypothetical protein